MQSAENFLRALRGSRRPIPPSPAEVADGISDYYVEFWQCSGINGWLESERGRFVWDTLDAYERAGGYRWF